jgi:TonB family protein
MSHRIFPDRSEAAKHLFSLAVSLVVHVALLGFLIVHFAAVKLITFDKARVTDVILAPPLPPGLILPKVGSMPSDLPPIEPDYLDSIPVRRRPPSPEPSTAGTEATPAAGSELAQGFRLDQAPPPKTAAPSGDNLRLPIPNRRPGAAVGTFLATGPRENVAFQTYLYSDSYGGLGAGLSGYAGIRPRRSGLRGGAYASAAVKGYDLTPWANRVAALIQNKWAAPGTWHKERNKSVEITVVILKNGRIFSALIAEPSDDKTFDQSAMEAVEESGPLPSLPADFPEASLEVSLVFTRQ